MSRLRTAAPWAVALAVAALAAPGALAGASDAYYERTLMMAAGGRCSLFTPDIASALAAGAAQARGAALRAGVAESQLQSTAGRARARAAAVACNSPDLATAAGRVRDAFAGYSRLLRMTFPGDASSWKADRTLPLRAPAWRLSQTASLGGSPLTFGLVGQWGSPPQLMAVADFGDEAPYAARLVLRDPARAPQPYLNTFSPGSGSALQARTPPAWSGRVFAAEARSQAEPSLRPPGARGALAFRFPPAAAAAIAELDPREAVTVEFLFAGRTGEAARKAFIEVGDFSAGQAFLTAARR
jgi:hypothetical protein